MLLLVCNKEDGNMVEMELTAEEYRFFMALQDPNIKTVLLEYLEKIEQLSSFDLEGSETES